MRISYQTIVETLKEKLINRGFSEEHSAEAAEIFAANTQDGILSHGVNRFPRVLSYIDEGYILPGVTAQKEAAFGALERWDGQMGFGVINARICMDRACELAGQFGIGMVALRHTNHWMRGGYYGWQAAEKGLMAICWTNTMANMPPWGAKDRRIGNNPIVMAIPRANGEHVVLDGALSQFSYGKIEECRLKGKRLPVPGGYDENDQLTDVPGDIEKTWRVLPIGFWKGSSLSIVLDMMAAGLSDGNAVCDIAQKYPEEIGLSQVFIAMKPGALGKEMTAEQAAERVITDLHAAQPVKEGSRVCYPGEQTYARRMANMEQGSIEIVDSVWEQILSM